MVGMHAGESRDLTIKLPDEFEPAALRGVDVACTVAVSELFSYDLPEVSFLLAQTAAHQHVQVSMLCCVDAVLTVLALDINCLHASVASTRLAYLRQSA